MHRARTMRLSRRCPWTKAWRFGCYGQVGDRPRFGSSSYFARLGSEAAKDCDICLANYFLTSYPAVSSNVLNGNRAVLTYNIRGFETISHGSLAEAGGIGRGLRQWPGGAKLSPTAAEDLHDRLAQGDGR